MNKNLRYLLFLMAGMLTLASPTCVEDISPERGMEERLESLQFAREDLVSPALTRKNLEAFEFRAKEKLDEYADYLGMVSDTGLDLSFREQARENLLGLFLEGRAPEFTPRPDMPRPDMAGDGITKLAFHIDSVTVINPLEKVNKKIYRGRLAFRYQTLGILASDTIPLGASMEEMGMVLQKKNKEFGEKHLQVWEVQLAL